MKRVIQTLYPSLEDGNITETTSKLSDEEECPAAYDTDHSTSYQRSPLPSPHSCNGSVCSFLSSGSLVEQMHWKPPRMTEPSDLQIAKELSALSVNERSEVYEELHGVAQEIQEEPAFVDACITKVHNKLRKILSKDRAAYEKAAFLNPRYVKSQRFLLMFLRAERFDTAKATYRLVNHFEEKLKIFGPKLLAKQIFFDDLDEETKRSLFMTEGAFMFSTLKDRVGRVYFIQRYVHELGKTPGTRRHAKALWYMIMASLDEDERTQKRGVNMVGCTLGTNPTDFMTMFEAQKRSAFLLSALPLRMTACHVCVENVTIKHLVHLLTSFYPKDIRVRTKLHYGTPLECGYSLQTFGIDRDEFPLDSEGKVRPEYIHKWVGDLKEREREQQALQRQELPPGAIEFPTETDVLMGRGLPYQRFSGTAAMMKRVKCMSGEHIQASRVEKKILAETILKQANADGCRFLERHPSGNYWIEVDDAKAHEKIAMGLRNSIRSVAPKN